MILSTLRHAFINDTHFGNDALRDDNNLFDLAPRFSLDLRKPIHIIYLSKKNSKTLAIFTRLIRMWYCDVNTDSMASASNSITVVLLQQWAHFKSNDLYALNNTIIYYKEDESHILLIIWFVDIEYDFAF